MSPLGSHLLGLWFKNPVMKNGVVSFACSTGNVFSAETKPLFFPRRVKEKLLQQL
jgi:hypothetical protein